MHLNRIFLHPEKYPAKNCYPFNQQIFKKSKVIHFDSPVSFFIGENGTGKSTLLEAIAHKCGIHIWCNEERMRYEVNPYEKSLHHYLNIEWENDQVPGSFFGADIFRHFVQSLDEWAVADPAMLQYFGGKSLVTQSHGQSLLSFFRARYKIRGLYLLDEPETALSPRSQLELLKLLVKMAEAGHAQFIIATHSPILMACPDATIFNFDVIPIEPVEYQHTEHYLVYKDFMLNPDKYLPVNEK